MRPEVPTPQDVVLAQSFRTLGNPVRVALLRRLVAPAALRDLVLAAEDGGGAPTPMSRQAVRGHLDKLIEARLVAMAEVQEKVQRYVANPQVVYLLAESLSEMLAWRPLADVDQTTQQGAPVAELGEQRESCFLMVKGPDEGRRFPLVPSSAERDEWLIGRRGGADVRVDYDGHVSGEHALVTWDNGQYFVQDLPRSRNGTFVNFLQIGQERQALRNGDLVTIGRTNLLFRQ